MMGEWKERKFGTRKKYKNIRLEKWLKNLEIREWVDNLLIKVAMKKKCAV